MDINYNFGKDKFSYEQTNQKEIDKLNFLLTNNKGDFLMQSLNKNSCKYQGLNICDSKTLEIFKFVDEIFLKGMEVESVEYGGYFVKRRYASKFVDEGGNENINNDEKTSDRFYLGPTGGMIYDVKNYSGRITVDLDMRKNTDFDKWGRKYNVYEENGVVFVEYSKKSENNSVYNLFLGIKSPNFSYELLEDWIEKNYKYSESRHSLSDLYIFRLMGIDIMDNKRIFIGSGFNKAEVLEQISLLESHSDDLEKHDKYLVDKFMKLPLLDLPITQDVCLAYALSNNATYNFLNKSLNNSIMKQGSFAGFPWFANIWARDELIGLRALINNDETEIVKEKLMTYLNSIDVKSGMLKRIEEDGSLGSPDAVFLLAKRFEDFIFHNINKKNFNDIFSKVELEEIFDKFYLIFNRIIDKLWDKDIELIKVKYGDSWMDTVENMYPVDIQVEFLEMVSFIVVLAEMTGRVEVLEHLKDFESMLKEKIRSEFFRNGYLYNEPFEDKITSNVFLCYYLYPSLFEKSQWEEIFDNSLKHLKTSWGGISSISNKDIRYKSHYTGENNWSYHRGDSWFWINNLAAISMNNLNEKKYRHFISKIVLSSTHDILKFGTIGYSSEISSAAVQESVGAFAQLWSSTTYLEMIDNLHLRK